MKKSVVKKSSYFCDMRSVEDKAMPVYVRHLSRDQCLEQALEMWRWQQHVARNRTAFPLLGRVWFDADVWMWLFAAAGMPVVHRREEAFPRAPRQ